MKRHPWILLLLLLPLGCAGSLGSRDKVAKGSKWVEKQLATLTVEQKVGQIMAIAYHPRFYNEADPHFRRMMALVREYHLGGATFYRGDPYAVARCIERLQSAAEIPLLMMADVEWGVTMRINEGTPFLQNMAVGATGSEDYAYEQGRITAEEARAFGIHVAYAPTLDVNSNPDNIIVNTRAYGEQPELAGRLGAAFIRGLQAHGIYATIKHFPGHGDTNVDSHLDLPVITASQARVRSVELPPFQAGIDAGAKMVMVSHLTYSAFPQMEGRPATLDPYFIQEVLKKEMGFQGMVVTDAMDMGGVVRNYWSGEAAVMAINAGIDMVLVPPDFEETHRFVVQAVKDGRIAPSRLDDALRKVLETKYHFGLTETPKIDYAEIERVMASPEHLAKAEEIASAAMTLVRDQQNVFPIHAEQVDRALVVAITDEVAGPDFGRPLFREVQRRIPHVRTAIVDARTSGEEMRAIIGQADSAQAVIAGVFVKWGSHKGSVTLADTTTRVLSEFFECETPLAVVSFGSPYVLRQIPNAPSYLCAYSTNDLAVRAAGRAIFGEIPLSARLPVSIPGHADIGDGLTREAYPMTLTKHISDNLFSEAYAVLEEAIADSVFPGAQIAIVQNGQLLASRGVGHQTYAADAPAIDTETIYDLASVTKVAATTTVAMQLWEQGKLPLDIPVKHYLPKFHGGAKERITMRHLFTHSSGVHWWADLWNQAKDKAGALDYIYQLPLDYAPGDSMIYSDLGLIMIGEILQTVTGKRIDQLSQEMIYRPMEMTHTMYNPPKSLLPRIAPTEIGGSMHRGLIHGDVHDENTFFFNGISTHAGLFSTAEDLAALAQMLLNGGIYRQHRFMSPQTVRYWTTRQKMPENSIRALGWTTPYPGSLAGSYFSEGSFGHTGFTGTSMWVDPQRKIAVILLTNRVHPTRERGGIAQVRRKFHDAVMKALIKQMGEELPDVDPGVLGY